MPTELKTPTEQPKAASKTFTNWDAFAKAGLRPVTITCQAYAPYHRVDRSCHSNLRFKPEDFKPTFVSPSETFGLFKGVGLVNKAMSKRGPNMLA